MGFEGFYSNLLQIVNVCLNDVLMLVPLYIFTLQIIYASWLVPIGLEFILICCLWLNNKVCTKLWKHYSRQFKELQIC